MGNKYNYYDTPSNHPESVKYRHTEAAILIFGIGVVTTLLILSYLIGHQQPQSSSASAVQQEATSVASLRQPACEDAHIINVGERDRLIQLLDLASDLPIADVQVKEFGTVCYDNGDPRYDVQTDIVVTVDYISASKLGDFEALGNHVATILPVMMQIQPDTPHDVIIRFLVGDTYLEWSHTYLMTNLYTQGLVGEELWFWTEPTY